MSDSRSTESSEPRLFGYSEDWAQTAGLHWSTGTWSRYADGYIDAADRLVEDFASEPFAPDELVFPVSYLYRHYVELRLKSIIVLGNRLREEPCDVPTHHRIDHLWEQALSVMTALGLYDGGEIFDKVGNLLRAFSELDPNGVSFRYAEDLRGQPTLQGVKYVDIEYMRDRMNEISNLLDGILELIDQGFRGQSEGR